MSRNVDWIKNMKAAIWGRSDLINDSVRVNELNAICFSKFKQYYHVSDLLSMEMGTPNQETRDYARYLNIKRAKGSQRRR